MCINKQKLEGVNIENYNENCNDLHLINLSLNIVDIPEAEDDKNKTDRLQPCFFKKHLNDGRVLKALDISIEITKNILYNLNMKQISKFDEDYSKDE